MNPFTALSRSRPAPAPPPPPFRPFDGPAPASARELPLNWRPEFLAGQRAYPAQVSGIQVGQPVRIPSQMMDMRDAYGLIPAAFTAVSYLSEFAARIPLQVYRRRKGNDEPLANHELSELLHPTYGKANPWTTAYQTWLAYFAHTLLVGTGYLLKERRDKKGIALEYHVLRPDWVETVPGARRPVDGYLYGEPGATKQKFTPDDVIPLALFNPFSTVTGLSPLTTVRKQMILELYMQEFNINFFRNGATLGGVITLKQGGQETVDRVAQQMNERHQGVENAHRWKVVAQAENVTELGKSMKDLQYDEGLQRTMQKVLQVCKVPPVIIGSLDGASYANAQEQIKLCVQAGIMPLCANRDSALNLYVVPGYGDDLYVVSDFSEVEALLPMMETTVNAIDKMAQRQLLTRGEAREMLKTRKVPNLGAREDDDEYVESASPFGDAGASPDAAPGSAPAKQEKPAAAGGDEIQKAIDDAVKASRARIEAESRKEKKAKERVRDIRVKAEEGRMVKAIRANLEAQKTRLLANVQKIDFEGTQIPQLLAGLRGETSKRYREALHEIVSGFGEAAIVDLGATGVAFNTASAEVIRFLHNSSAQKIVLMDATTADTVRRHIQDALAESQLAGENIVETATRIMEKTIDGTFSDMSRERAVRIAQTETTTAFNFADHEAWKQSGVVTGRRWNTQSDGKVRSIDAGDEFDHAAMEGVEVGIDEPFLVPRKDGGTEALMFPGDPSGSAGNVIEERCFMTPVLSTSFRVQRLRSRYGNAIDTPAKDGQGATH